jgi:hypothetical protein
MCRTRHFHKIDLFDQRPFKAAPDNYLLQRGKLYDKRVSTPKNILEQALTEVSGFCKWTRNSVTLHGTSPATT